MGTRLNRIKVPTVGSFKISHEYTRSLYIGVPRIEITSTNASFTAVVWFHFNLQFRGVRIIVVGIGPDAERHKYRQVLEMIGGKNLFFVDDYDNLDDATQDIVKLICRKYNLVWVWES